MTGVAWAPSLPDDWGTTKLGFAAQIYAGGTPDRAKAEHWSDGDIPWLASGSVNDWIITQPSEYITEEGYSRSSAKWIPPRSVLIALAGQGRTKGMSARLEFRATCNQSLAAIVPNGHIEYRYLHYWLTSNYRSIRNLAGGDLRDGLNLQHVASIECPVPPRILQVAIADFLDRETARIDALIEAQRTLVDLLASRFEAVLAHFMPSPDDGRSMSLTRAVESIVDYRGATPKKVDDGIQLVTARNVKMGFIDYECSTEFIEESEYHAVMRRGLPARDDLLMTMEAPLGNVALVDNERIALAQRVIKMRAAQGVNPRYLRLALMAPAFQAQLESLATGSTALGLKAAKLHQLKVTVPSPEDQTRITGLAEREERLMNEAIETSNHSIALIQERRSAVIAAAVTGRIDPRTGKEFTPEKVLEFA